MTTPQPPAKWERFVAKHERVLLLADLAFTLAVATFGLMELLDGNRVGWIFLLVAVAGAIWTVTTHFQARRVRQYDAARLAVD